MIEKIIEDFDIQQIADSGQCFRISHLSSNIWQVIAFRKKLLIEKITHNNYKFYCSEDEFQSIWSDYFDLQTDYGKIKNNIRKFNDQYLNAAVNYGFGIRILRQDLWETIISFIISQRNNIPRIRNTINKICKPYDGFFPTPEDLVKYTELELMNFGLGYRSRYIFDIARSVIDGKLNLSKLKNLSTEDSLNYLKTCKGIGGKVANCIALFGLYKTDAFPIDVWIQRIIDKQYNGNFSIDNFKDYAGIVQQYMFFYQKSLGK